MGLGVGSGEQGMENEDFVAGNQTDKYGTRNPIARAMMNGFMGAATSLVSREGISTILEVGCGEGELAQPILGATAAETYLGTDLSSRIIEEASTRNPDLQFEVQNAETLPYPDASFDLVVACEVLEHVENPEAVLSELNRLSARWILVSVPREPLWRVLNMARGAYWGDLGNTPGHIQHWGKRSFIELVSRHLTVKEVRSPIPWTMLLCQPRS